MAPGAIEARCETCHASCRGRQATPYTAANSPARRATPLEVVTCLNCHIGARLGADGRPRSSGAACCSSSTTPGRVKLGNFLTYVHGSKTMITLARIPHSIKKQGRACGECHGRRMSAR